MGFINYAMSLLIIIVMFSLILSLVANMINPYFIEPPNNIQQKLGEHKIKNRQCSKKFTSCKVDKDCEICSEGTNIIKYKCQKMTNLMSNSSERRKPGITNVCNISKPYVGCNLKHGGIWQYSPSITNDHSGWKCSCQFSRYYSGNDCNHLNPEICSGGTFTWDVKNGAPSRYNCLCPSGTKRMIRDNATPFCADNFLVDNNFYPNYTQA
jgi:hypothetical protein